MRLIRALVTMIDDPKTIQKYTRRMSLSTRLDQKSPDD
jgi:hypothetical protein